MKIQDKTALIAIVRLHALYWLSLKSEHIRNTAVHQTRQVKGRTLAVRQARRPGCVDIHGLQVGCHFQSVSSLGLFSVASMSSSTLLSSDESSFVSSKAGIGTRACTFKAKARLGMAAGDPIDMGLSEQELCPDPLNPRPILGGTERLQEIPVPD